MTTLNGQCHCGNISFQLNTELPMEKIIARACDCSFCRIHAAKNWSDPAGQAVIKIGDEQLLNRYLFALKTAEFLICRQCGAYAGAVLTDEDGSWATLNLRLTGMQEIPEQAISFDGENISGRVQRRKQVWVPVQIESS